jgi:hypothetical protein
MRVLITASRDFNDLPLMYDAIRPFLNAALTIIHGNARGGDQCAEVIAERVGANVYRFSAEWDHYGRAAGHVRNVEMFDTMQPEHVLAFPLPGSKGTWDAVREAKRRGIPVTVI